MPDALVPPREAVQGDLWWALRGARRLAGMAAPRADSNFARRFTAGLTHVVSLVGSTTYDPTPLTHSSYGLEDLYGRATPADITAERTRITAASSAVRDLLDAGQGVLVHCLGGTGRTGTVIGAVLCSYGIDPAETAAWLDAVHKLRGQSGWPESPWQRTALDVLTLR